MRLLIADFRFQIEFQIADNLQINLQSICNQSEICNLKSAISTERFEW